MYFLWYTYRYIYILESSGVLRAPLILFHAETLPCGHVSFSTQLPCKPHVRWQPYIWIASKLEVDLRQKKNAKTTATSVLRASKICISCNTFLENTTCLFRLIHPEKMKDTPKSTTGRNNGQKSIKILQLRIQMDPAGAVSPSQTGPEEQPSACNLGPPEKIQVTRWAEKEWIWGQQFPPTPPLPNFIWQTR